MKYSLKRPYKFKLGGIDFIENPAPGLAELRAIGPIVPIKIPMLGAIWVTTTHAATEQVMKGKDQFFLEWQNAGKKSGAVLPWWFPGFLRPLTNNMLGKDEPDHKRLRTLVDMAFRRRGVMDMRAGIEQRAHDLIDQMGPGSHDLVSNYARKLPLEVICDLLGLTPQQRDQFSDGASVLGEVDSVLKIPNLLWSLRKLHRCVDRLVNEARKDPQPGLMKDLIEAENAGDRLNQEELSAMIFLLLFAGMETTTNLISGAVWALDQAPDQKTWLMEDPENRREQSVEELTRFVTSVAGTKPRYAGQDVEIQGVRIAKGERVMALPLAANYDPTVFDTPEVLNVQRFPNPHLSFSAGIHFCLGLQLARVETQAALQVLYERFPHLVCEKPVYLRRPGHRAVKSMKVMLT